MNEPRSVNGDELSRGDVHGLEGGCNVDRTRGLGGSASRARNRPTESRAKIRELTENRSPLMHHARHLGGVHVARDFDESLDAHEAVLGQASVASDA